MNFEAIEGLTEQQTIELYDDIFEGDFVGINYAYYPEIKNYYPGPVAKFNQLRDQELTVSGRTAYDCFVSDVYTGASSTWVNNMNAAHFVYCPSYGWASESILIGKSATYQVSFYSSNGLQCLPRYDSSGAVTSIQCYKRNY